MAALRALPASSRAGDDPAPAAGSKTERGGPMSFDHPWLLVLVLLPLAWGFWEWRTTSRRTAVLLKTGAFVAICLALAQPRLTVFESKVAVALLTDVSASVSDRDLQAESAIANQ